jgi:hypothetical protein
MRAIVRRLRRIEAQLAPKPNALALCAVDVPWERRRRRADASGEPFQELLPRAVTTPGRHLSVAETLRHRRRLNANGHGGPIEIESDKRYRRCFRVAQLAWMPYSKFHSLLPPAQTLLPAATREREGVPNPPPGW